MGIKGKYYLPNTVSPCSAKTFDLLTSGLTGLLSEHAPRAMKDHEMKTVSRLTAGKRY